jgi:16S rRNA (guanine(966)-N(2))-methyltransferase RsmD
VKNLLKSPGGLAGIKPAKPSREARDARGRAGKPGMKTAVATEVKTGDKVIAAKAAAAADRRVARAPHEIRIIGGAWRGRKLPVPDAPGLRPTPDRVRETLFNWLGQDLTGWTVLDAFAGTGVLGFEAASRGAAAVTLIESDRGLSAQLQAQAVKLKATTVTVLPTDALSWMRRGGDRFDLVLLDPPFEADLFEAALSAAAGRVGEGGWVYLEASAEFTAESLAASGWERYRHARAGAVHAHLLRRA